MNPIKRNAIRILQILVEREKDKIQGIQIQKLTNLTPREINDAVSYLEDLGAIEVTRWLGTPPYEFGTVRATSRGRYLYHGMKNSEEQEKLLPKKPINPVGSPYGFTDEDWEFVALRRDDGNI